GSLGFDLETGLDATLIDTRIQKIPSTAVGPLYNKKGGIGGLLLGRSSAGVKGLLILPGVIDTDYTGRIYIMVHTVSPPMHIPKGSRIAQIVHLQNPLGPLTRTAKYRGDQGFGSSGATVCFSVKMEQRLMMRITMSQQGKARSINAMLDTGADVTIIS
ncbi:hypothetical protein N332_12167, partial [Mesitornis unicolor]